MNEAEELEQLLVGDEAVQWPDEARALHPVAGKRAVSPAARPAGGAAARCPALDIVGALAAACCALLLLVSLVLAVSVRYGAGSGAASLAPPDIGLAPRAVLVRYGQGRPQRVWGTGPEFVDPDDPDDPSTTHVSGGDALVGK